MNFFFVVAISCIPFFSWWQVFCCQFHSALHSPALYRLCVLSTRAAAVLPLCTGLMLLRLLYPNSSRIVKALISCIEGISIFSFFSMLVHYYGGTGHIVVNDNMPIIRRSVMLNLCAGLSVLYLHCYIGMWLCLCVRPVITALQVIFDLCHLPLGEAFCGLINILILAYAIGCVVLLCK